VGTGRADFKYFVPVIDESEDDESCSMEEASEINPADFDDEEVLAGQKAI
jgi:hypothetical protein